MHNMILSGITSETSNENILRKVQNTGWAKKTHPKLIE